MNRKPKWSGAASKSSPKESSDENSTNNQPIRKSNNSTQSVKEADSTSVDPLAKTNNQKSSGSSREPRGSVFGSVVNKFNQKLPTSNLGLFKKVGDTTKTEKEGGISSITKKKNGESQKSEKEGGIIKKSEKENGDFTKTEKENGKPTKTETQNGDSLKAQTNNKDLTNKTEIKNGQSLDVLNSNKDRESKTTPTINSKFKISPKTAVASKLVPSSGQTKTSIEESDSTIKKDTLNGASIIDNRINPVQLNGNSKSGSNESKINSKESKTKNSDSCFTKSEINGKESKPKILDFESTKSKGIEKHSKEISVNQIDAQNSEFENRQKNNRKLTEFPKKSVADENQIKKGSIQSFEPSVEPQVEPPCRTEVRSTQEEHCTSITSKDSIRSARVSSMAKEQQVRVLTLQHDEHLDSIVFRLQKGYILQLRPGPSLFGKKVLVFTNHPADINQTFVREQFRELPWLTDSSTNKSDVTSFYVEIPILMAGSFRFYFVYGNEKSDRKGSGYFLVDPVLTRGKNDEVLPLDGIQCQTVMTKCLGTMDKWLDRLKVSKESGYNMVHFTPVQELGGSKSGYSLADQLKLNPSVNTPDKKYNMSDLQKILNHMKDEWKILSLTDIVLNHTANESLWLQEHPESTYNLVNSPHLRPAYLLDRILYHFSLEVSQGKWAHCGIPKHVNQMCHVEAIRSVLFDEISKFKLEEFYLVDSEKYATAFEGLMSKSPSINSVESREENLKKFEIVQDEEYGRLTSTVDLDLALQLFNIQWSEIGDESERKRHSCAELKRHLDYLNGLKHREVEGHLRQAVQCTFGTICYERLQDDGPRFSEVSKKHPLISPYFTHYGPDTSLAEEEKMCLSPDGRFLMAHNGWVMGFDPLKNFAARDSNVYLRRELIAWGDSVKLRYGEKPEDSQFLWDHMRIYVEETAKYFHGIRLDNCHSTPIHVAEYLLDCARKIRPDLYVIAELFTNSTQRDNVFVNRLGINSLIREGMSAPNSHEEGRLVYLYGGEPVGAFVLPPVRPLAPSVAHAIFMDMTHDNKSPCEVRSWWDLLPSSALINMASCASGSNRGYDEVVPHHIHVVNESRPYALWSDKESPGDGEVNGSSGIIKGKKLLNDLHFYLAQNGYNQVFVDQVTEHVVTVTRHNPVTHQSVVLVAYTSFAPPSQIGHAYIRPLKVQGKFEEIIFEMNIVPNDKSDEKRGIPGSFLPDPKYINGVDNFDLEVRKSLQPGSSRLVRQISAPGSDTTEFEYTQDFRPGSVIAFRLRLLPAAQKAVDDVRNVLSDFVYQKKISKISCCNERLCKIVNDLTLADLNRVLFRCDQEEKDEGRGWGSYNVNNVGSFVYCGLQGVISPMGKIRVSNDLGHPICGNLRDGNWLLDYISGRLKLEPSTAQLSQWLEGVFSSLKMVPRYLIPSYFDAIITAVYLILVNRLWQISGRFVNEGSDFAKALGMCSVQFCGVVKSALLPQLSPNLQPPKPPTFRNNSGQLVEASVTLSAGLPHFSTGYMRNWGRDTFIALPGNLLITERFQEARWIILAYAATLRHGLIPNLLDGGLKARFNCRDSIWFWLYAIQQYVQMAPNGSTIFKDKVSRLFPQDDMPFQAPGAHDQPLEDVIQEALQVHFQGLKFRERNAGFQIDSQMKDPGFDNEIGIDKNTGFPFGGNCHNCGTWMDKMGSSEKAGNKGVPSTPRDGSAVEIVGLCHSAVFFLAKMNKEGHYSHSDVEKLDSSGNTVKWSLGFWADLISQNFEKIFWINGSPDPRSEPQPHLINRRGIYKDTFGSMFPWADYQLRCNFPIAIVASPSIFTPERAFEALKNAQEMLLGPLGIKTLDPTDWKYRGDYHNDDGSDDPTVANGANYHQGPEWVWPVGFLLRAKLLIASRMGAEVLFETRSEVERLLAHHFSHITTSPWRSLPELTNAGGAFCKDSNPAQSWSTGCVLEVLYEMERLGSNSA